ncbi:hypothetical protein PGUG_02115 [Meyerozyma guilliermondii ATCC 6260]|uniref:Uncharacterized protein n=1 Tax=Meyerozyma guilliermondii (strain ATCC 6260 / CBS 566 / DSM 6381 / JCM 1539 / NBRC 10279 / NRRL Y-324) TaxID=294746 RepID=A5DFR4_PICGU|nr:uncharacterized protein PGUG_02115 [Meyerozyma guilliermondii ATCC 6260]EDK38017.2 hypothetical protein PGUG_02115 [Meyerozyma guilliermondii ATCC 6260]
MFVIRTLPRLCTYITIDTKDYFPPFLFFLFSFLNPFFWECFLLNFISSDKLSSPSPISRDTAVPASTPNFSILAKSFREASAAASSPNFSARLIFFCNNSTANFFLSSGDKTFFSGLLSFCSSSSIAVFSLAGSAAASSATSSSLSSSSGLVASLSPAVEFSPPF